jgi:broad specificity phosphatase PhoE
MSISRWRLVVTSIAIFAAWTPSSVRAAETATGATTVFLVRHAEKVAGDGDVSLSTVGRERAALLAWTLKDANVTHIFASQMARTKETAAPLADKLKIEAEVVRAQDPKALVAALRALPRGSTALVVGHSNTVPAVVEGLGGPKVAPIGEDEFDRLLVLTLDGGTTTVASLRYGPPSKEPR